MRIILCSHFFAPSVGGIEQVSGILAEEWAALGHDVTVVTTTPDSQTREFPFHVLRNPGIKRLWRAAVDCDVFFQNNISLRTIWPAALLRKPLIITYHTWVSPLGERRGWQARLKALISRFASRSFAVSKKLAESVDGRCQVIRNPFRSDIFRLLPDVQRSRDLVFVGRLVSDKGVKLCLDALALLKSRGCRPNFTIIGSGPEEENLRRQCHELEMDDQVSFAGQVAGENLVRLLNAHRILIVPSKWWEPFGLVALEGIACGCVAVGSAAGGLPDAIGLCGLTYPTGDVNALCERVQLLLSNPGDLARYRAHASSHLAKHDRRVVAEEYLEIFRGAIGKGGN